MKNSEYNHNKVTNEGASSLPEFTKTQGAEATFQPENKAHQDDLNTQKTVNDSVEGNGVILHKKTKYTDYKKMKEGTTHLASSAGHAVVAATTISVAVVATVVGVEVFPSQEEEGELITFVSSEITSNSIDFAFTFPTRLMAYDETEGSVVSEEYKEMNVTIADGINDDIVIYLEAFEEITEETSMAFVYYEGLNPGTSYGMSINLLHSYFIYEEGQDIEPIEEIKELAFRSFTTEEVPELNIQFSIDASYNAMQFSATMPIPLAFDESGTKFNPDLEFAVYSYDDTEFQCSLLSDYTNQGDYVTIMGGCSGLKYNTSY